MLKKISCHNKKHKHFKKEGQKKMMDQLTPEELDLLAMQMSWSYGMLPPCYLPYEFWHF